MQPQRSRIELHHATAQSVSIAGIVGSWHPSTIPMTDLGGGRWVKELVLQPGRYEYRFIVDGKWISDPNGPESSNSVLVVPAQNTINPR